MAPSVKEVVERRTSRTDVQIAGRTGRYSNSDARCQERLPHGQAAHFSTSGVLAKSNVIKRHGGIAVLVLLSDDQAINHSNA